MEEVATASRAAVELPSEMSSLASPPALTKVGVADAGLSLEPRRLTSELPTARTDTTTRPTCIALVPILAASQLHERTDELASEVSSPLRPRPRRRRRLRIHPLAGHRPLLLSTEEVGTTPSSVLDRRRRREVEAAAADGVKLMARRCLSRRTTMISRRD